MKKYPKEWQASEKEIANGWKNKPEMLSEIVTAINNEEYVADENAMMETMDIVLEWMKSKYKITKLNK